MKIKYLAHAAFLLTANNGTQVLTDPYESGAFGGSITYKPISYATDIITISHSHADHSYIAEPHKKAIIINTITTKTYNDIAIRGLPAFHDTEHGKDRGNIVIFVFEIDGIKICHLGDLGHTLSDNELTKLGTIDILLIPVGGIFTLDLATANDLVKRINPKICIPMHYKTSAIKFDLAPVETFTRGKNNVVIINKAEVIIDKLHLPKTTEIWVFTPAQL